jgi:vacuolar protein sorting-associated protein IST1
MSKLGVGTPPASLVDAYLGEIAKGYGLDWTPPPPAPQDGPSDLESKGDNDDTGGGGGLKVNLNLISVIRGQTEEHASQLQKEEERELLKHVELSEKAESVKLPDLPSTDSRPSSTVPPPVTGDKAGEEEDELSSLTRRFAALRKR